MHKLFELKTPIINRAPKYSRQSFLDISDWRTLQNDITTDGLWISSISTNNRPVFLIPKRDWNIRNDSGFHGLFIPEIPYQFIRRFTNEEDYVWDCFGGSGTTKRVADYLNRNCIINDLHPTKDYIIEADTRTFNPNRNFKLVFMHPPYYNIVKYSDSIEDGSNQSDISAFYNWFEECVKNVNQYVENKGFIILVMGNIYIDGEEIDSGVACKEIIRKYGYKCKSHIIKDYGETKGSDVRNYNLNFVRQLRGNYNNFYGDNIFILQKVN